MNEGKSESEGKLGYRGRGCKSGSTRSGTGISAKRTEMSGKSWKDEGGRVREKFKGE